MLKLKDILAAANAKVAEYMALYDLLDERFFRLQVPRGPREKW